MTFTNKIIILSVLLCNMTTYAKSSLEVDIINTTERLELIQTKLKNQSHLANRHAIVNSDFINDYLFNNAKYSFKQKEFRSVIKQLNIFLQSIAKSDIPRYLSAQYMLGISYDYLDEPTKAHLAFERYLSTITTNQEYLSSNAIEVVKKYLNLSQPMSTADKNRSYTILSSMTSLSWPTNFDHGYTITQQS